MMPKGFRTLVLMLVVWSSWTSAACGLQVMATAGNSQVADQEKALPSGRPSGGEAGVRTEGADSELPRGIIDVTHAALLARQKAGKLTVGQRYRITDFQTIHVITWGVDAPILHKGPVEPLIVTAETKSILGKQAISELYPDDVIHYVPVRYKHNGNGGGGDKGVITYRWEPERNIETHFDWRHAKVRLWEEPRGSGNWVPDPASPAGLVYRDFSLISPRVEGAMFEDIHIASTNAASVPRVVFMGSATKVRIEDATDAVIFMGNAWDVYISSCASLLAYDHVDNLVLLGGEVVARKPLIQVLFGPEAGGVYEGSLVNCQIFAGWNNGGIPVTGDRVGELIGYPAATPRESARDKAPSKQ